MESNMDSRDKVKMEGDSKSYEQQTETEPRPCAKLCGFYGNPATHNLCSRCYKDYRKKLEAANLYVAKKKVLATAVPPTNPFPCFAANCEANNVTIAVTTSTTNNPTTIKNDRCGNCNKKIGLFGFSCRCQGMFCSAHRYPEEHACAFDYKTPARIAVAKENPLCRADKLNNRL